MWDSFFNKLKTNELPQCKLKLSTTMAKHTMKEVSHVLLFKRWALRLLHIHTPFNKLPQCIPDLKNHSLTPTRTTAAQPFCWNSIDPLGVPPDEMSPSLPNGQPFVPSCPKCSRVSHTGTACLAWGHFRFRSTAHEDPQSETSATRGTSQPSNSGRSTVRL